MDNSVAKRHPTGPGGLTHAIEIFIGSTEERARLRDGFAVLRGIFLQPESDHYNAIILRARGEVDDRNNDQGYGDRIGQLHQTEPDLLRLASSPRIHSFLRWAFNDDPLLMGSLQFEKGTQQEAHIDAILFRPEPACSMAGVWVAIEDIHADAVALFYIPGCPPRVTMVVAWIKLESGGDKERTSWRVTERHSR
ncbi:hypothetical protein HDG34_002164, partial [Paraburkholderia sp. HC6.4b]|uniref:phytanoyl-CoA dioxygenase family protein n=1 Tax=unclassified Paraburkholderia TaxID=2615204 RepID=UPI00161433A7